MSKSNTKNEERKGQVVSFSKELQQNDQLLQGVPVLEILGQFFYFKKRYDKPIPSYKEISKWRRNNPESIKECPFDIIPSKEYGWPGEDAYKIWSVYEKKLSDKWGGDGGYVDFGDRELARLIGRSSFGGNTSDQCDNAIWQLYDTKIILWKIQDDGKIVDRTLKLIDERIRETDIRRGCVVGYTIRAQSEWRQFYVTHKFYTAMSWNRISHLPPGSHRLARFLIKVFTNRYYQEKHKGFLFKKDYEGMCHDWLGGAPARLYMADIVRHLDPLFKPLVSCGILSQWIPDEHITKNKKGDGFNIIPKQGDGFFEDYEKYYSKEKLIKFPDKNKLPASSSSEKSEVLELWKHAQVKVFGRKDVSKTDFEIGERKYIQKILDKFGYDVALLFINFAAAELPKTGFDKKIQTLNGLSVYEKDFNNYRENEEQRLRRDASEYEQMALQKKKKEYESYLDDLFDKYLLTFDQEDLDNRRKEIQQELGIKNLNENKLDKHTVKAHLRQQLFPKINAPSFEEWLKESEAL